MVLYVRIQMYDTCYVMMLVMCALIFGIVAHNDYPFIAVQLDRQTELTVKHPLWKCNSFPRGSPAYSTCALVTQMSTSSGEWSIWLTPFHA